MKLCLAFHCLCESYDRLPESGRDLFVSLDDMAQMIEEISRRGYRFSGLEDQSSKTMTITFDDGYHNNLLFKDLAQRFQIPYLVFISSYYAQSGQGFPWLEVDGATYEGMHDFDYYQHFAHAENGANEIQEVPVPATDEQRPMNFHELKELLSDGLSEIGCHGYYHQPLSQQYQHRLEDERDLGFNVLHENLGITPRYYALANGMYTRPVLKQLLDKFDRVLTIDGRPYSRRHKLVHRMSLVNPQIGGPLITQIDKSLHPARQLKRAVRIVRRVGLSAVARDVINGVRP